MRQVPTVRAPVRFLNWSATGGVQQPRSYPCARGRQSAAFEVHRVCAPRVVVVPSCDCEIALLDPFSQAQPSRTSCLAPTPSPIPFAALEDFPPQPSCSGTNLACSFLHNPRIHRNRQRHPTTSLPSHSNPLHSLSQWPSSPLSHPCPRAAARKARHGPA